MDSDTRDTPLIRLIVLAILFVLVVLLTVVAFTDTVGFAAEGAMMILPAIGALSCFVIISLRLKQSPFFGTTVTVLLCVLFVGLSFCPVIGLYLQHLWNYTEDNCTNRACEEYCPALCEMRGYNSEKATSTTQGGSCSSLPVRSNHSCQCTCGGFPSGLHMRYAPAFYNE